MWYLQDSARFGEEVAALQALEAEIDWLTIDSRRIDAGTFIVDVEIRAADKARQASLRYPATFPHSPPSVLPRVPERWSGHQFGLGELCLEWGPDNWVPSLSGADMVRSAHKLLSVEAPDADGLRPAAPSRHATSLGQDLRHDVIRFLVTDAFATRLGSLIAPCLVRQSFYLRNIPPVHLAIPLAMYPGSEDEWRDPTVSADIERSSTTHQGFAAVLPASIPLPATRLFDEFKALMTEHGCSFPEDYQPGILDFLVVLAQGRHHFFWLRDGVQPIVEFAVVHEGGGGRSDPHRASMADKRIAIVGCGSAGSKIAVSLARAGVRDFVFIDDDVLLPGNLVRNELDWDGVATHKVDALKRRIEAVAPGAKVVVRRHRLGGQESNGGVDGALSLVRQCDLAIDATADAHVFNLLGGVMTDAAKPLIWLEIYGGGIGGLVARSRPGLDPSPHVGRARIDAWCADKAVKAPRPVARYEADAVDGPMIADDADVSVIAAHAVRYAIDILAEASPSAFPVSAYFIGLRQEWLFTQPFHCFPVDLGPADPKHTPKVDIVAMATIAQLLKDGDDRSAAA